MSNFLGRLPGLSYFMSASTVAEQSPAADSNKTHQFVQPLLANQAHAGPHRPPLNMPYL